MIVTYEISDYGHSNIKADYCCSMALNYSIILDHPGTDAVTYNGVKISFCPHCGRKIKIDHEGRVRPRHISEVARELSSKAEQ